MSTYIEYNVLKQLNNDLWKNIKIIYVFGCGVSEVLIVTKDDIVFGFGQNDGGVLGFGHNRQVLELIKVEELSGKGIISFANGYNHVIGLTKNGKIYNWGQNDLSQLGNGTINNDFYKPEIHEYLIDENIVDICCGENHSIVLTEKSELYVWGYNNFGQIGNNSKELFQLTPFKLKAFESDRVVAISCGFTHSIAITDKGNVFSWGCNTCGQLGIEENYESYNIFRKKVLKKNKPHLVDVKNDNKTNVFIEKCCCGPDHNMLLTSDGDIYTFGLNNFGQIGNNSTANQITPQKIFSLAKYKDIASHFCCDISIALSIDNIFYIWGNLGGCYTVIPVKSQFRSFNDILLNFNQITYKAYQTCDISTIISYSFDNKDDENKRTENIDEEIIQIKSQLNHFSLLFSPNIIAKYRKQTRIVANFDQNIEISFHFYDCNNNLPFNKIGINALYVTEDSKVFAIGNNGNGLIGFDHKNAINEPIIVRELCDKGIIDFKNSLKHVIARTVKNQLYVWGYNNWGQLGNETFDDCFVPHLVEKLSDKCIVDICCGNWHSLALTESGEVYAWGSNKIGQIGNNSDYLYQSTPIKIQKFGDKKIISISCGSDHSIALTESGHVYSWGYNNCGQLGFKDKIGLNKPKRIKVKNNNKVELLIEKISCGYDYSLLLTSDGDIYGFGSNSLGQLANECYGNYFIPTKIIAKNKFCEIATYFDAHLSSALSIDGIYYIWGYYGQQLIIEPKEALFDSFNSIFLNYLMITYNKTQIETKYHTDLFFPNKQNSSYEIKFQELGFISFGSFGIVSKAKIKNEKEIYAIKRISFNNKQKKTALKEVKITSQLNSNFVVKVNNYWIEDNYLLKDGFEKFKDLGIESLSDHRVFDLNNDLLLHIQMELCFKSLKKIIKVIENELNLNNDRIMTQIHYYISSEVLIEILECVDYLHKQKPPIIHRDLKPKNILITYGMNGRFVKLCDFGLAKLHETDEQSNTIWIGSPKYMAPEVKIDKKYNTKADVYSLGVVIKELFKSVEKKIEDKPEIICFGKYEKLSALVVLMMKEQELRPNCESILNQKNLWALSISDIENDTLLEEIRNKSFSIEDNFHLFFIKKKLEMSKQLNYH